MCVGVRSRYKDAITAFVTILDVYYKHLDGIRQRQHQLQAAGGGGPQPKPTDYVSQDTLKSQHILKQPTRTLTPARLYTRAPTMMSRPSTHPCTPLFSLSLCHSGRGCEQAGGQAGDHAGHRAPPVPGTRHP